MEDPVILTSGFTYEKSEIEKHFKINGNFDPLTREEVNPNVLIQNKNLKHSIEEFIRKNPWAFEYFPGDSIHSVNM